MQRVTRFSETYQRIYETGLDLVPFNYQNGSEFHYIRFTRNDPKLQPIHAFVDQLYAIKTQYLGDK